MDFKFIKMKHLLITLTLLFSLVAQAQQVNDTTFIAGDLPSVSSQDFSIRPLFDANGKAYHPENEDLKISMKKIDSAGTKVTIQSPGYLVFIPTNEGMFNVRALFKLSTDFFVKDLPYGHQLPWGVVTKGQYKTKISQHSTFRKALDSGYKLGGTKNIQKGYFEVWQYYDGRIEIKQPLIRVE